MDVPQRLENFGIGDDELDQLLAVERDLQLSHLLVVPPARRPSDADSALISRIALAIVLG